MKSLRPGVALIGVSGYARIHLDLACEAHSRGEIELCAAVIINPEVESTIEAQLRGQGCRIYRDYAEMLRAENGKLSLCLIPTGIQWHTRMTIAALQAGANVLVEKPLAGSLAEVALISAAEQSTGRWVAVGFQDIYCPLNRWLKMKLIDGAIGRIERVKFVGIWPRSEAYYQRNDWAGRLSVDGVQILDSPLNNAFAHFVNLSLYLAGKDPDGSTWVSVDSAELWRTNDIESFDSCVVRASSRDGISFWFGASHSSLTESTPTIIIEGTEGSVEWIHERSCALFRHDGSSETHKLPDASASRHAMFTAVVARLANPTVPLCGVSIARCHTAFIEAVHSAAPIKAVPKAAIVLSSLSSDKAPTLVVKDLEAAITRAFNVMGSLDEAGFGAHHDEIISSKKASSGS